MDSPVEADVLRSLIRGARRPEERANEALDIILRDREDRKAWLKGLSALTGLDQLEAFGLRVRAEARHASPTETFSAYGDLEEVTELTEPELAGYPRPDFSVYSGSKLVAVVETKLDASFHGVNQPATYLGLRGGTPLVVIVPKTRLEFFKREVQRLLGLTDDAWSSFGADAEGRCISAHYRSTSIHLVSWEHALSCPDGSAGSPRLAALGSAVEGVGEDIGLSYEFLSSHTAASLTTLVWIVDGFKKKAVECIKNDFPRARITNTGAMNLEFSTMDFIFDNEKYFVGYLLYRWAEGGSPSPLMIWNGTRNRLERSLDISGHTNHLESIASAIEQLKDWIQEKNDGAA